MSEVLQAMGSPGWWFSTVIVAIVANIISNFIHDALKTKLTGHWFVVSVISLQVICSAFFVASVFTLTMRSELVIPFALGMAFASLLGLIETYQIPEYGFAQVITIIAVSSLTFFEPEFPRALAARDLVWFGREYFYCVIMACVIQAFLLPIFFRRHIRKRQGLTR